MLSLKKIRVKKRLMLFVASIVLLLTGVFFALKQIKTENTNAATADRTNVTIVYDPTQDNWPYWVASGTRHVFRSPVFTVQTSGGNYTGFCIDPWLNIAHTGSSLEARVTEQNKMKLAIYIYTINNSVTNGILSNWGVSRNDNGFARFHAILSYINTPDVTEAGPSDGADYPNTVANWSEMMAWLRARVNDLGNYISNNDTVWQMARDYQLYNLSKAQTSDVNLQSIAWIEQNYTYGSITVQKQDYDSSSSTPQGNASLQGVHFQVLNNSGSQIYNPKTDTSYNNGAVMAEGNTNASGVVTFSNLPAGYNYKVRETTGGSNTSYTITNSDVGTVTLTTSGHTFNYKNQVKRG